MSGRDLVRRHSWAALGTSLLLLSATAVAAQQVEYRVAAEGNEARYRVREQLANIDFPSDAVGTTSAVTGAIVIGADGRIVKESSKFTIDLTTLATDSDMRDNFVRRNTLQTETHGSAVFVPTEFRGVTLPLPASGEMTFQMVGELTLREVTRPVTWEVTAKVEGTTISGQAKTQFTFADFEMTKPSVRRVLSVNDEIRLEYDFRLVRQ